MKCPKCNQETKDGMRFCSYCGSGLSQIIICKKCGLEIKNGHAFCSNCGTNIYRMPLHDLQIPSKENSTYASGITCPICSSAITINDKTCSKCHRDLEYNCNSCKNNFTYGEVIMNKGHCPHCGTRITRLHNIPDDKYPFSIKEQVSIINDKQTIIREICKYASIFYLFLSFLGSICILLGYTSEDDNNLNPFIYSVIACACMYFWIRDLSDWKFKFACGILCLSIAGSFGKTLLYSSSSEQSSYLNDELYESGRKAVLNKLNAPTTAVILSYVNSEKMKPFYEEYLGVKLKDYQDITGFEVEAENGFGGRVRNKFFVYYVDKHPIDVAEEETAFNPNKSITLNALNVIGFFKK